MSVPSFTLALRLRAAQTVLTAAGMIAVIAMVGALFPAVGDSIGRLDLPDGVSDLLGGADYGSIRGWMRSEIGAIYGPLVIAATAITAAVGSTAAEEQDRVLALELAYPVSRTALLLGKAAAVAVTVAGVVLATFLGLLLGVGLAGGGVGAGYLAALCLHLLLFGWTVGGLALGLAGLTGSRAVAAGGAAAFGVLGFLLNGFAPLVGAIDGLKYLSPFHYYVGHDPIGDGVHLGDLAVLTAATAGFVIAGIVGFNRRDLRG